VNVAGAATATDFGGSEQAARMGSAMAFGTSNWPLITLPAETKECQRFWQGELSRSSSRNIMVNYTFFGGRFWAEKPPYGGDAQGLGGG
jgi:hypothetical protein